MTQREQVTYHPGWSYKPVQTSIPRNDVETVTRLAANVQARDVADGIEREWDACYRRADENLAYVKAWAETGRRPE